MGASVRPDPTKPAPTTRILTGDEWEQAQYAPHRAAEDPTTPMGPGRILTGDEWDKAQSVGSLSTLKLPALPKFASDATKRLNPNAGPADRSIPEQLGAGVRHVAEGFDAAALGLDPVSAASAHVVAALGRQAVAPAVEHPLVTTALANPVGAVIGTGMAAHTIAAYGWQKAHELGMSPEDRARAEADPKRVSGEAAAVQALMLGLGGLASVKALNAAADVSGGMVEAGTQSMKSLYFETPKGAEVLGTIAAQHGMPETASPYPAATPLDAAWKDGHATTTKAAAPSVAPEAVPAETAPVTPPTKTPSGEAAPVPSEPTVTPSPAPYSAQGTSTPAAPSEPTYKGPAALYGRLSDDALAAEYRTLIEKRSAEQPNAIAPIWDAEREARAVEQIENRRRPDGTLSPADKRRLASLQAAQGEEYGIGRHTFESAAAERRVTEMTKHITAIEKEAAARGLNPDEMMRAPSVEGGALPAVEGTGELKTRGLAQNVEQRAVAKELTDYLGDLPEYRQINMADQAARAVQLLADDPALARRVALGEEPAPHGLLPESVFKVVEGRALAEGDVATIRDLASGGLTEQATTMGQRIRALAEREPDSPVAAIQEISKVRGGAKNANESITASVAELNAHLESASAIDVPDWVDFIDSLRC